ncbi:VCBS repeat-containing protein [Sediminicola sp. 1XM1-17]|uniref:VCBS repeat-containing protein n=1 Tax=Sediminicola sp. 1XM1-17 TaxID=3127702 RepID=UPI003077887C
MNNNIVMAMILLLLVGCGSKEGELFTNPSPEKTGITFSNTLTESNDLNILDYLYFYNGGGVAIGDINGDGLPDIYLSGNQVKNKLYLNKGNLTFEDITEKAGVAGNSTWNTGAVMGDVNGDGLLDIYVCAVVGINGFNGYNELFINNGDSTFTESAAQYGLDFETFSSNAAFLDYDLDGDLDLYLLNHAVHTQESFGRSDLRLQRDFQTGDRLLRNDGNTFVDVSEEAGIYGGVNGYGLGVAISDFNQDGWPDIYVGNDFHEDDYYYLNNGDGTFKESLKEYFGQTTRFSMGNDVGDINHDGWPDIISLDMLPEDETVLKSSEGDDDYQIQKLRVGQFGYHYQFTRNMLHINQPGGKFKETALLSGIAATDWSWSSLFADYDQDGEQDIFISNGIPKRPNDLDFINFASNDQIKTKIDNTQLVDQQALDMMPSGNIPNYVFKGTSNLQFIDKSKNWIKRDTLISGATAMGDLDNDGDLDIVTNNINHPATLYINKTDNKANYLKIKLKFPGKNPYGIGSKILSYHKGILQYKEMYTVRGFQASSEPLVHFGYGKDTKIDSIRIIWPNRTTQLLKNVKVNQTLVIAPKEEVQATYPIFVQNKNEIFKKVEGNLGLEFEHKEDSYFDFNRQKLIPYQFSDRGPAVAIGDLTNDGNEDIFFGGSKFMASKLYVQHADGFKEKAFPTIKKDSIKEDVVAVIEDFNKDGKKDLFIGSGGADFFNEMPPLLDSYYTQKDTTFVQEQLPATFQNASVLARADYDLDGDMDLFVGNQMVTNDYGKTPYSYVLQNKNGKFEILENESLNHIGMVTDAVWDDYNGDGTLDLIVVGEWMQPTFFKNKGGTLIKDDMDLDQLNGLWQSIIPFDIDKDGDKDYLLGNWGLNSKFKASQKSALKMYYADFDNNGSTETIVTIKKNGEDYPIEGLKGLSEQLISLRKKFTAYKDFAGKPIKGILSEEGLKKAKVFEVHELSSGYLENNNGNFTFVPFNVELQMAPIMTFLAYDFDGDGAEEVLAAGNYFGVKPYHGRLGSFAGAMIKSKNNVILGDDLGLDFSQRSIRHLNIITFKNKPYLIATFNNEKVQVYQLINNIGK